MRIKIIYTDGCNPDFIMLCHMLDAYLNHIIGCEKNRSQYIQYMSLYNASGYSIIENHGPYRCMKDSICMEKTLSDNVN